MFKQIKQLGMHMLNTLYSLIFNKLLDIDTFLRVIAKKLIFASCC